MENQGVTLEKLGEGIEKLNKRFDKVDKRFDSMENNVNKRFDKLTTAFGSLEVDMIDVKTDLAGMDKKYDGAFEKLDKFLGRLTDQESESTLLKNEQSVIKTALNHKLGLNIDSPEFRWGAKD